MYVREVEDQELTFQVSGKLWMRSLIMRDIETGSEWSQLLGKCMAGKLKGQALQPLITDMVTWQVWKQLHPESTVLNMSRTSREYTKEFYRDASKFVFGFEVEGKAYALPMSNMKQQAIHNFDLTGTAFVATFDKTGASTYLFESKVGEHKLVFEPVDDKRMRDLQTGSLWDRTSGQAIEGELKEARLTQRFGMMSYASAWMNFHPKSVTLEFDPAQPHSPK